MNIRHAPAVLLAALSLLAFVAFGQTPTPTPQQTSAATAVQDSPANQGSQAAPAPADRPAQATPADQAADAAPPIVDNTKPTKKQDTKQTAKTKKEKQAAPARDHVTGSFTTMEGGHSNPLPRPIQDFIGRRKRVGPPGRARRRAARGRPRPGPPPAR